MKFILLLLLTLAGSHAELSYIIEEEEIAERGKVSRCRIQTDILDCVVVPPLNWGWKSHPHENRMSFINDDISGGIHIEITKKAGVRSITERLKNDGKAFELREQYEAISGQVAGEAFEAEIWGTENYSYILREAVFVVERGVITVRLQVPKENLERAHSAWTRVLNSLREIETTKNQNPR